MNKFDDIMDELVWSYVYNAPEVADNHVLTSFENRIGFPLPADYREFLAKYGITKLTSSGLPLEQSDVELAIEIEVFYGFKNEDSYDLNEMKEGFGDELPGELLPIAAASGGQLCLWLDGPQKNQVSWWYPHDQFDDPSEEFEFVAATFTELMKRLVQIKQ